MTASKNTPLNVPFKEKDEAKALGARWNPDGKHWYVPEGVEVAPFEKWLIGDEAMPQIKVAQSPKQSNQPISTLPKNADFDEINAMLRSAYEPDNAMNFSED